MVIQFLIYEHKAVICDQLRSDFSDTQKHTIVHDQLKNLSQIRLVVFEKKRRKPWFPVALKLHA